MLGAFIRFVNGLIRNHCKRTELLLSVALTLTANFIWNGVFVELPIYTFSAIYLICSIARQSRMDHSDKAVLITGCDSGFGYILAGELQESGCNVIATSLDPTGENARNLAKKKVRVIKCDVSKDDDISQLIIDVEKHLNGKPLHGVVNNAGISAFGDVEWTSINIYKRLMDVNVWGVARVTTAMLPLMREHGGRIVVMASGLGRIMQPSRSPYALSKWAVEALAEALRLELYGNNIKVSILEPGNYLGGTQILNSERVKQLTDKLWDDMSERTKRFYPRPVFEKRVKELTAYKGDGNVDLTPVIEDYKDALFAHWSLTRYQPMERYWKLRSLITTHLPSILSDWLYIHRHQ